jgi:NADH:ubiquinone oxidoreductase subunit D
MDRLDYVSMMCSEHAYVMAIEKMLELDVPIRAQYIRVMFDEITRLLSHLLWLGSQALDMGAMAVILYAFREREDLIVTKRPVALVCMLPITVRVASVRICRIRCRNSKRRNSRVTSASRP